MNIESTLRHTLRALGQRFPQLRRYSGRLGLGRLVTDVTVKPLNLDELSVTEANNALFVPSERVVETLAPLSG